MPESAGHDAGRMAEDRADQIEIVDRMHRDLDSRRALQEREEVPGRDEVQMYFDIDEPAEQSLFQSVGHGEHHGREAKLEVYGGAEPLLPREGEDLRRLAEVATHGFLQQNGSAIGERGQDIEMGGRRQRKIEN